MKYIPLILSTFFQLSLGGMALMLVIFSSAGIANGHDLTKLQNFIFMVSMLLIPASSLVTAGVLVYLSLTNSPYFSYWWHTLPVALIIFYVFYAVQFN